MAKIVKDKFEDKSYDRAVMATNLLKNRNDFHDVYEALKAGNKGAFETICRRAKITDEELIADVWDRWLKITAKVDSAVPKPPGPVW